MGHLRISRGATPLGELILNERRRRGLTRVELATQMKRADRTLGTNSKTIERWELRGQGPQPAALRALAAVLGRQVEELTAHLRQQVLGAVPGLAEVPPAAPADHEYIEAIHGTIGHLVGLEVQHGGDEVAPLALRHFQAVRRRLAAGGHQRHLDRDLTAATAELAELAGWLLHDADDQDAARRMNNEALHLARLAGERSVELLTMSNMAFVALFNRQPGDASMLARAALRDPHLTNRQRVIFELREARAMAQLGAGSEAVRAAEHAAARYWDGATREDSKWSWWIDTNEVEGHVAWAYVESGEPAKAMPMLQRAIEACPPQHANNHFFRLARHLGATVDVGAWEDAEEIVRRLLPYAAEVRSGRAVRLLRDGIEHIEQDHAPARLRESVRHLGEVLVAAGYEGPGSR